VPARVSWRYTTRPGTSSSSATKATLIVSTVGQEKVYKRHVQAPPESPTIERPPGLGQGAGLGYNLQPLLAFEHEGGYGLAEWRVVLDEHYLEGRLWAHGALQ